MTLACELAVVMSDSGEIAELLIAVDARNPKTVLKGLAREATIRGEVSPYLAGRRIFVPSSTTGATLNREGPPMVLRPGLIVALCFLVYGCFGDTEAVRCETLKQSIDVLQPTTAPISVDSEEIQQRLSTLGYTESENAGYTRLLLDDPSFSWDSRTTSEQNN